MNWIVQPDIGLVWHNGATYGYNSILVISKKSALAVVAMTDTTVLLTDSQGKQTLDSSFENVALSCLK